MGRRCRTRAFAALRTNLPACGARRRVRLNQVANHIRSSSSKLAVSAGARLDENPEHSPESGCRESRAKLLMVDLRRDRCPDLLRRSEPVKLLEKGAGALQEVQIAAVSRLDQASEILAKRKSPRADLVRTVLAVVGELLLLHMD